MLNIGDNYITYEFVENSLFSFFKSSALESNGFTESEARELTWSRLIEETALSKKLVEGSELREITAKTAHTLGEEVSFKRLLLARSYAIVDFLKTKFDSPVGTVPRPFPYRPFLWGLTGLAFFCGILTNEFSVSGNRINLLSPPLVAVILWNIAVYFVILISYFFSRGRGFFGPLRNLVVWLILKIQKRGSQKIGLLSEFYQIWTPKESPLVRYRTAEVFHFAALFFGLGLIVSIGLHGWGTAFTIGWESTWLADNPDAVLRFIHIFYGVLPINASFFDSMTLQTVEAMQFGGAQSFSAAPWLLQLFWILLIVVIIPRALLAFYCMVRANILKNHFALNLEAPYYTNILRQWKGKSMLVRVIPFSYPLTSALQESIRKLVSNIHPENINVEFYKAAHEDSKIPDLSGGEQSEVLALFAMTSTPENEVQGTFLKDLKKSVQSSNALLRVLVDTSGFVSRFSKTPQRIEERKKNWSNFLSSYDVNFAFVDLANADSSDVIKQFERV